MPRLRIVNWGHRRATGPVEEISARFAELHPEVTLDWSVRPLGDFEHQGIQEAAHLYDIVVFDHPFCGEIAASGAFQPLEPHFDVLCDDSAFAGPSLKSYRFAGHVWGAPIDAATQVAVYRPDLLEVGQVPNTWQDVIDLGRDLAKRGLSLAQPVQTPHALLTVGALMANRGLPWTTDSEGHLQIDAEGLEQALEDVCRLQEVCTIDCLQWNSIDVYEALSERSDIVYTPCVYGFATYGESDHHHPLAFAHFAGPSGRDAPVGLIGGTALGLSKRCQQDDVVQQAALGFLSFLLSEECQVGIVPRNHGQPALAEAWDAPEINKRYNGFYDSTRHTQDVAAIRPRVAGYPAFQKDAGIVAARAVAQDITCGAATREILSLARLVSSHDRS